MEVVSHSGAKRGGNAKINTGKVKRGGRTKLTTLRFIGREKVNPFRARP